MPRLPNQAVTGREGIQGQDVQEKTISSWNLRGDFHIVLCSSLIFQGICPWRNSQFSSRPWLGPDEFSSSYFLSSQFSSSQFSSRPWLTKQIMSPKLLTGQCELRECRMRRGTSLKYPLSYRYGQQIFHSVLPFFIFSLPKTYHFREFKAFHTSTHPVGLGFAEPAPVSSGVGFSIPAYLLDFSKG